MKENNTLYLQFQTLPTLKPNKAKGTVGPAATEKSGPVGQSQRVLAPLRTHISRKQ